MSLINFHALLDDTLHRDCKIRRGGGGGCYYLFCFCSSGSGNSLETGRFGDVEGISVPVLFGGAPEAKPVHPVHPHALRHCKTAAVPNARARLHAILLLLFHRQRKKIVAHLYRSLHQGLWNAVVDYLIKETPNQSNRSTR